MIKSAIWLALIVVMLSDVQEVSARDTLIFSRPEGAPFDLAEEALREAYQRLGISIETSILPGERAIWSANQGVTDGEVSRVEGLDSQYPNLVRIPVVIEFLDAMAFVKKARFEVNGWESLRDYTIGIRIGSKFAERGTEGMNTEMVVTHDQAFKKLAAGRNDVVVFSRIEGMAALTAMRDNLQPMLGITMLEPPIERIYGYHYLHKKHSDLIPLITSALQELEEEGRIQKIWDDYLLRLRGEQAIRAED